MQEVAPFPPIQNTATPYATEAAMHADQANQLQGYGYLVDGVGAFTYLGTVAGTAADYEAFMPTKDISLRSNNTASTIYFHDALDHDLLYAFIRYNAASNYLEFGSNDNNGLGDVVSAQIDRGKTDWEFKNYIIINKPGRGVRMYSPDNAGYEIRTNDGGVLELWALTGGGNLDTLVWSSATSSGLDLRASNLAGDLSTAEKGGIRTKIGAVNVNRNLKMLTSADMPYTLLESDKDKFLNFQDGGTVKVDGNLMSFGEGVIGVNVSGVPLIFEGITVPEGEVKAPEGKIRSIKTYGTFSLYKSTYDPAFVLSGDLVTDFEIFESPNGTLYKVGVDDTGAITSIAL